VSEGASERVWEGLLSSSFRLSRRGCRDVAWRGAAWRTDGMLYRVDESCARSGADDRCGDNPRHKQSGIFNQSINRSTKILWCDSVSAVRQTFVDSKHRCGFIPPFSNKNLVKEGDRCELETYVIVIVILFIDLLYV